MVQLFNRLRGASIAAALWLTACGPTGPALPDPAMDGEVRRNIAAGIHMQSKAIEYGAFDIAAMTDKRTAPVKFDGKDVLCARLDDPARAAKHGGRDRVIVIDLVQFIDSPMQGPWFDYLWRRSGC